MGACLDAYGCQLTIPLVVRRSAEMNAWARPVLSCCGLL
ncbi:hypothetical a-type peptide pheromone precursor, partial [Postia placenta Mad-698-R]